jgi:hypothetical protein
LRSIRYAEAVSWAGADIIKLQQVAAARGYKNGWVHYRLQDIRSAA